MKSRETKENLLVAGVNRTSVHGLSGVTLGQLTGASSLSRSGLFTHLRPEARLQIELLDETARRADRTVLEPSMQAAEGFPRSWIQFANAT